LKGQHGFGVFVGFFNGKNGTGKLSGCIKNIILTLQIKQQTPWVWNFFCFCFNGTFTINYFDDFCFLTCKKPVRLKCPHLIHTVLTPAAFAQQLRPHASPVQALMQSVV
jgi:hypothetical protein